MLQLSQAGDFQATKYLLENQHLVKSKEELEPSWYRPAVLNDRQQEIIDCLTDDVTQIILVEGDRRTGKSTAAFVGICENIWLGKRKAWGLWASSEVFKSSIAFGGCQN
jgi:hypothetical protein